MDETRAQAYHNLIESLLNARSEEEIQQILRVNFELLDLFFLQTCEQVAATLAEQGEEGSADFLRKFASRIGEVFGFTPEDYLAAFWELLLRTEGNNLGDDPKHIYAVLEANIDKLNLNLIPVIQQRMAKIWGGLNDPKIADTIASLVGLVANKIYQFPRGKRADNLEIAISAYKIVLSVYTLETNQEMWACTQSNLGVAYVDRIRGGKADNTEQAISFCNNALEVYTCDAFPQEWALVQHNLGNAYVQRLKGKKADNIEQAIAFYNAALEVRTRAAFHEQWADTQNNLGEAYCNRIRGEKADNIEQAIAFYKVALQIYTRETFPEKWAGTQHNLGKAYRNRIKGERADNLELAMTFYTKALEVRTRNAFPQDWAQTQNNLVNVYVDRIRGEKAENIEQAIICGTNALEIYKRDTFPWEWATMQNNLAVAYLDRIKGSRADNLEQVIRFYTAALEVFTREAFPQDWAQTQNNLGEAYRNRIRGESANNLELAIAFYTRALEFRTREAFPEYWAMTKSNLAAAYSDKIIRERTSNAENIKEAIKLYQQALEIRTPYAFPLGCLKTGRNLGNFAFELQDWENAIYGYENAISAVEQSRDWAGTEAAKQEIQENAIDVYFQMLQTCINAENLAKAVETVERSKARNLVELLATRDLYPKGNIPQEILDQLDHLRRNIPAIQRHLGQKTTNQLSQSTDDTEKQLRSELTALQQQLDRVLAQIKIVDPNFNLTQRVEVIPYSEIQSLAANNTAIIEWYITRDKFLAFVIAPNSLAPIVWQSSTADFNNLENWNNEYVGDYRNNNAQWQQTLADNLQRLAEILHLDELLNLIPPTCDQLVLIPHRYLHLFPIHALPVTHNTAKYLIDAFPGGVSYAPSCQILHQVQKYKRGKFDKLFAIQNPKDNLIAADMEVETIKNIFPHPDSEILAKKDAKKGKQGKESEEKLEIAERVANCHHLFFSCHGYFDLENPLQSGLELADGILTLEEIFRHFHLSECSLVTLSACETGQVRLDNTDEYISLTSGFLLAGSPSLYVTLWSVNALSTAILLIKTYENLYHQPGKLALALNQAQIWVRDTDVQGFLDWTKQCGLLDQKWRETLQRNLNRQSTTQGTHAKIYQNPYHWAGFCAAGKGEQNMTNSITKIEIFQQLIQESDLFVNLRDALVSLKDQLTDDDENNVKIIEDWIERLPENDKNKILGEYEDRQFNTEKITRSGQSDTKKGQPTKSLKEIIENLTVAAEKTPKKDPNPSL